MHQPVDQPASFAGPWRPARRGEGTDRIGSAVLILERFAWIAAFPVYVVMAVVITLVFANAALVTELKFRASDGDD